MKLVLEIKLTFTLKCLLRRLASRNWYMRILIGIYTHIHIHTRWTQLVESHKIFVLSLLINV